MILTRKEFAEGLHALLLETADPLRIAAWAYQVHLSARSFEEGVEGDLLQLVAMDMGEEFELSRNALYELAKQ